MTINEWLEAHFVVIRYTSNNEAIIRCPKCGKAKFYFNLIKKVGWCHIASCHYAPTIRDLQKDYGWQNLDEAEIPPLKSTEESITSVPGLPIFPFDAITIDEKFELAVSYLQKRGIQPLDIKRFQMTFDGMRVYVPVYYKEKLVSYVGRDILGLTPYRYKYPKGSKISEHFLGWDEAKLWNKLTLVENTFVSIWLRNYLNCTTNFGSHLSEKQIEKIKKMKHLESVAIMWDKGAEERAENACLKLACLGIPAAYARLKGQPDDYTLEEIIYIGNKTHERAKKGKFSYEPRL